MADVPREAILYRLLAAPRARPDYTDLASRLAELKGFTATPSLSDAGDLDLPLEFKFEQPAQTRCTIQLTRRAMFVETAKGGVDRHEWDAWRDEFLKSVGEALGWKARHMQTFATVRQHRFAFAGNNYNFLRDQLLRQTCLHAPLSNLSLTDFELALDVLASPEFWIRIRITSNQRAPDIRARVEREDSCLLVEFHAFRTDLRGEVPLVHLAQQYDAGMDAWLNDRAILVEIRRSLKL